jgi:pyruvate/2-oxoglutarate dehydrogenase complex dihydrolipoamide dehydrogenase (E3) component
VAGCFAGNEALVIRDDKPGVVTYDALIVATGSTDLPYPFPGATYPGVFSGRALQILVNQHRVRPGRRFAIIGPGDEAEELSADIQLAGGDVVWSGIAPAPFLEAFGEGGIVALRVGQDRHEVDVVAIAVGRQSDCRLATMTGTPLGFTAELGGLAPVVDNRLQRPGSAVFVAGDAAGVGSVAEAVAEGRLAGVAAAAFLGLVSQRAVDESRKSGGAALARRIALRAGIAPVTVQPYG